MVVNLRERPPRNPEPIIDRSALIDRYKVIRAFSKKLCTPLATEDFVIQSMPDVSPTKWHLAHTSWFFEAFLLAPHTGDYRPLHTEYHFLFNSYYVQLGERHCRPKRGLISRPTVEETFRYRDYVDEHVLTLLEGADDAKMKRLVPVVTLGLHHEQQHQELMLTDIKHVFWSNPLRPGYVEREIDVPGSAPPMVWHDYPEGIYWIGHQGSDFAYDNESPRHRQFVAGFRIGSRLVTNGEYLRFVEDGGYERPELWLSAGWYTVEDEGWQAPLYWEKRDGRWWMMALSGMREVNEAEPVCHVSYFEADAYARWVGARLPTEAEWEIAASEIPVEGHFVESGNYHPAAAGERADEQRPIQMYGDLWQWTQSAYAPYPGFKPLPGAAGEYNGKFMCNQYVLRGASCATPRSHARKTYRNFFPPDARWQFMGIRLAQDI